MTSNLKNINDFAPVLSLDRDQYWPNMTGYFAKFYHRLDLKRIDVEIIMQISCFSFGRTGYTNTSEVVTIEEIASRLLSDATPKSKERMVRRSLQSLEEKGYLIILDGGIFDFRPMLKICLDFAENEGFLREDPRTNKSTPRTNVSTPRTNVSERPPAEPVVERVSESLNNKNTKNNKDSNGTPKTATVESSPKPTQESPSQGYDLGLSLEQCDDVDEVLTILTDINFPETPKTRYVMKGDKKVLPDGFSKTSWYKALEAVLKNTSNKRSSGYHLGSALNYLVKESDVTIDEIVAFMKDWRKKLDRNGVPLGIPNNPKTLKDNLPPFLKKHRKTIKLQNRITKTTPDGRVIEQQPDGTWKVAS